jgi:hypothetical protein
VVIKIFVSSVTIRKRIWWSLFCFLISFCASKTRQRFGGDCENVEHHWTSSIQRYSNGGYARGGGVGELVGWGAVVAGPRCSDSGMIAEHKLHVINTPVMSISTWIIGAACSRSYPK